MLYIFVDIGLHYRLQSKLLMHSNIADAGYDWEYFKFPANITPEMVSQGNGTYEFVMVVSISK